jgi:hypothetical protein
MAKMLVGSFFFLTCILDIVPLYFWGWTRSFMLLGDTSRVAAEFFKQKFKVQCDCMTTLFYKQHYTWKHDNFVERESIL